MTARLASSLSVALALAVALPAAAQVQKTFKHDQFHEDLTLAATQVSGMALATQPGWAEGEAFGQIYRPDAGDYPVKILGLDLILAAAPNLADGTSDAFIEVWLLPGDGPDPGKSVPDFSIHTADLYNPSTGGLGMPLVGSTGLAIDFDWTNPDNHPPLINAGNFMIVIRYDSASADLQAAWGTAQCMYYPGLGACGCQEVGTLHDEGSEPNANLINYIGMGVCSGTAATWAWANSVGIPGDYIIRARTEVAGACAPDCTGLECGDDGCGGECGPCGGGETCDNGSCVPDCTPDCAGKDCGADGCGGECGPCGNGQTCDNGTCVGTCSPDCAGKDCGADGCGGVCGSCGGGETCENGACVACTPDCAGKDCGADGCDGVCGTCGIGETCESGACVACTPDCANKDCGDDGCGGGCGTCGAEQTCQNFTCVANSAVLIEAISPEFGYNDSETDVSITGSGFAPGATVKLGGTNLSAVQVVSASLISATVPADMEPAGYMLIVANSDGTTASLADAFTVRERLDSKKSSGCGQAGTAGGLGALWLVAALLTWGRRRRRG